MAGAGGIEPPNGGIKILIRALTCAATIRQEYDYRSKFIDLTSTEADSARGLFETECRHGADNLGPP